MKKGNLKKFFLCVSISLILAIGVEIFSNWNNLQNEKIEEISLNDVRTEGFHLEEGKLKKEGKEGTLYIDCDGKSENSYLEYIDKFVIEYARNSDGPLQYKMTLHMLDGEGKDTTSNIYENNNIIASRSSTNIREDVKGIEIVFPEKEKIEISKMYIDNSRNLSPIRFGFVFTLVCCILGILLFTELLTKKLEIVFLIISLMVGTVTIAAMPPHKVGWDEEIHFYRAYQLSYVLEGKDEIFMPPSAGLLTEVTLHNWPYDVHSSEEEYKDEKSFWDANGNWEWEADENLYREGYPITWSKTAYITQALFIEIAKLLELPFSVLFMLGRFGNLLMYCVVTYFAIKHMKIGKRLMAVVALMPTPLFLACVYSYDATVNAFIFLGISYVLGEILSDEKEVSYKNCLIFIVAIAVASLAKMIYAPLLLLGFLIPNKKFRDKKKAYLFKGILTVLTMLMVMSFALPAATSSVSESADTRGGDTGTMRQMKVVFSHPVRYTKILLSSIGSKLIDYTIGSNSMSIIGHLDVSRFSNAIMVFLTFVAFTDKNGKILKIKQKIWTGLILFAVTCLIWTALYLSFTPVGASAIEGVQGRYFIPFTVPVLLLFNVSSINCTIKTKTYNRLVMITATCLTMFTYYFQIIKNCF